MEIDKLREEEGGSAALYQAINGGSSPDNLRRVWAMLNTVPSKEEEHVENNS